MLIPSGFMVNCGRDCFLIQLNSCKVSGQNHQIQLLPGEVLGDKRGPRGDRLPLGRVGRGLAPVPLPLLILHVLTLDSVPGTEELSMACTCYYYCDRGSSFNSILGFVISIQEKEENGV